METDLYREVEKIAHYFNTYIIANNINENDINIVILSLISGSDYNVYCFDTGKTDIVAFFLRVVKDSLSKYDTESMRYSLITHFHFEFSYYQRLSPEGLKHSSFFLVGLYFTLGEFFYNLLIASILKRYYTPYITYNTWKKYYNSYK